MPAWLGPVVTLTTQVGVPTVVAGVLLWFVLTRVDGAMQEVQRQEDYRTVKVAEMQAALIEALDRQNERFDQAIEKNIAQNEAHAVRLERVFEQYVRQHGKEDERP